MDKFLITVPCIWPLIGRIRWTIRLNRSERLVPPGRPRLRRVYHAIRILFVVIALRIRYEVPMEIHTGIWYRCHLAHSSRSMSNVSF